VSSTKIDIGKSCILIRLENGITENIDCKNRNGILRKYFWQWLSVIHEFLWSNSKHISWQCFGRQ